MTAPTDQFVDIAERSRQVVDTAVRTWADTVQSLAATVAGGGSPLPDLHRAVEQYFDFADQVLADQRRLAQQWVSGTLQASGAVTEQARRATQSVAAHTANSAEAVADNAAETAQVAAEAAGTTARAARTITPQA
jgi:hypothetical protein